MVQVEIKEVKQPYSWKVGLVKTLKNAAIFLIPSVLVYLAGIQGELAPVAGAIAYFIKNWYENR